MTCREIFLPGRHLRLAAKCWEVPRGICCLALHGWLDNANSFVRLAPFLRNVSLVALDLPGHGLSEHRSPDAQYHMVDWVGDVMAAADALGWQRFALMGHSMGAAIASLAAGAFPERMSHLVLLDGLGPQSAAAAGAPEAYARHFLEVTRLTRKAAPMYPDISNMAERLAKIVPNMSEANAALLLARGTRRIGSKITWAADPRLRGASALRLTEAQVLAYLRGIACPTLLVQALDGYPFEPTQMQGRVDVVQHLHHVQVPGGHHAHLETPEPVAQLINEFFATRAAPA